MRSYDIPNRRESIPGLVFKDGILSNEEISFVEVSHRMKINNELDL